MHNLLFYSEILIDQPWQSRPQHPASTLTHSSVASVSLPGGARYERLSGTRLLNPAHFTLQLATGGDPGCTEFWLPCWVWANEQQPFLDEWGAFPSFRADSKCLSTRETIAGIKICWSGLAQCEMCREIDSKSTGWPECILTLLEVDTGLLNQSQHHQNLNSKGLTDTLVHVPIMPTTITYLLRS